MLTESFGIVAFYLSALVAAKLPHGLNIFIHAVVAHQPASLAFRSSGWKKQRSLLSQKNLFGELLNVARVLRSDVERLLEAELSYLVLREAQTERRAHVRSDRAVRSHNHHGR